MARLERFRLGPYPVQARTERWGGSQRSPEGRLRTRPGIIIWSDPEDPDIAESNLIAQKVLEAQTPVTVMPQIAPSGPRTPTRISPKGRKAPLRPLPEAPKAKPPSPPTPAKPFILGASPSARNIELLVEHLETLKALPERSPIVVAETRRLSPGVEDWVDPLDTALEKEESKDDPNDDKVDTLTTRIAALEGAVEALERRNIPEAIEMLEGGY